MQGDILMKTLLHLHEVLQTIVQQIHKKLNFNVITFLGKIPNAKEKEELLHYKKSQYLELSAHNFHVHSGNT